MLKKLLIKRTANALMTGTTQIRHQSNNSGVPEKRILFLVSSMHGGGAERVAALLCNYWVRQGHAVTLMPTFSGRGDCLYPLDDRVQMEYLADRVGTTRKTTWNMVRRFHALRRMIRDSEADVVISFLAQVNVATLLASRGLSVPTVVSERTFPPAMPLGRMWELLRRVTYPWAEAVVVQTNDTARWMRYHYPKSKISVIANPILLPLAVGGRVVSPDDWLAKDQRAVVAAGRLGPEKGFDRLVRAFSRLAEHHPDWDLIILGEGEQRQSLEDLRDELGLGRRVHLPGRAGNLGDWYSRGDIYVLSSRFEGFPNTLLEAMAHGLPAVSFDCDTGPRDIIRPGIDGILVPPEQGAEGLAVALEDLMGAESKRVRMAEAAKCVRERFSMEKIGLLWDRAIGLTR